MLRDRLKKDAKVKQSFYHQNTRQKKINTKTK